MAKFEYETVDGTKEGFVTGFGAIVNGRISSDEPIENANLKIVGSPSPAPVTGTASQQNPAQPESAGDQQTNPGVSLG